MHRTPRVFAVFLFLSTLFGSQANQEFTRVPFDRYLLHAEMTQVLQTWHRLYPELTRLHAIGRSYLGKELWVLEITHHMTGEPADKPGFWADGGTHPDEPVGTPMTMHTAQRLLLGFNHDAAITDLLNTRVFYIMPMVNPDGTDHWLSKPGIMSHAMPWDSDRDGLEDEDPPEDLNGDGAITLMRVRDESGPLKT
jgi:murein tripeptide amidase MpaA